LQQNIVKNIVYKSCVTSNKVTSRCIPFSYLRTNRKSKHLKLIFALAAFLFLLTVFVFEAGNIKLVLWDYIFFTLIFAALAIGVNTSQEIVETETTKSKLDDLNSLFNQMAEAAFLSDPSGKIIRANKAACTMLNCSESKLIGNCLQEFYYDINPIRNIEINDKVFRFECVMVRDNGEHFYAEFKKQILENSNSLEIVRDITEKKEEQQKIADVINDLQFQRDLLEEKSAELVVLSAQLEAAEQKQKELNAEKDKFFSIIAHDLKSPFAGIMGYTTLLKEDFDDLSKEEIKEFILSLDKLSKNTFKLIENLLDWARLQTGKMKAQPAKLQLYESVLYATSLVSAIAGRKEIEIINNICAEEFVKADERMLNSILENFLSNSIKFTPRGGKITISSSLINVFIEITIEDNGVGMSPETLEKIFRIDANYTTLGTENEKGTGLGVVLCKEMIERQGGGLKVESELGTGTKFKFILPVWSE